ncbi:protein neprosin-like isoform X1 [Vicia villosa]|uniref:protein neprosin-like isoform X1 n=1 Tax=Vicia villosa TaxID=3911 RepID=UPI00273C21A3|nr:protein neprosin-like isoform X1 [Vicia villosa]
MNILFIFLCLVACITGMKIPLKEDLEIENELKVINKVPIKSFHTEFGYIVDCIDINNQPAFDHPLLINHKLQKNPSFRTTITNNRRNSVNISTKATFGIQKDKCPIGTVPIKRTTKDSLISEKSYFTNSLFDHIHGNHYAEVYSDAERSDSFVGVYGTSSVYNVNVQNGQSSSAVMYIRNGPDSTNYIGMGWHVAPELYNDSATHFYVVWTTDNFKNKGCFNLQCSGFVQTSRKNYLGGRFVNTSVIDGRMIEMKMSIVQDHDTKNWWVSNENEMIGYFPASLFPDMPFLQVGWGGRTSSTQGGPSPPMGSGRFPADDKYDHASYFINIKFQYKNTNTSPEDSLIHVVSDKPNCYYAKYFEKNFAELGYALQFGGPGGNCGD